MSSYSRNHNLNHRGTANQKTRLNINCMMFLGQVSKEQFNGKIIGATKALEEQARALWRNINFRSTETLSKRKEVNNTQEINAG